MAKQIKFTYFGKEYTLEYTRDSIRQMENEGFDISEVDKKPMNVIPQLFAGAFKAHHRSTKRSTIDDIYHNMPDKQKLMKTLGEMYQEPIKDTLMNEPDEDDVKNVKWEVEEV